MYEDSHLEAEYENRFDFDERDFDPFDDDEDDYEYWEQMEREANHLLTIDD
jgi:hypothetical protein